MNKLDLALNHRVSIEGVFPSVTPLYQNSAFSADSPYFYTRKDNPNVREFEETVAILENAKYSLATTNGMSAINLAVSLLVPGDALVVNKLIYGCSYKLFQQLEALRGVNIAILDLSQKDIVETFPESTKMVFFETPTNPFLKTVYIKELSTAIKARFPKALITVDNTWATPLYQHPLELGADISLHSATKFMSGHSDVMGGIILSNNSKLMDQLRSLRFYFGANLDPHSAWLLRRSLKTLSIRMEDHSYKTKIMRDWLQTKDEVKEVFFPDISEGQLSNYGGIIFFQLKQYDQDEYITFRDNLSCFDTGTGMACVTSMVAQPYTGSHASMDDAEKTRVGINKGLVRLCFGLESIPTLQADIDNALKQLAL